MSSQIVVLNSHELIKLTGPESRKFLQGQLSCNMDLLSATRSLRAAICNLQGRVIADLRVLEIEGGCLLQVAAGMANTVLATLAKYAVFSKVKLEIPNGYPAALAILGPLPAALQQHFAHIPDLPDAVCQGEGASLIRVAGTQARFELWIHDSDAQKSLQSAISEVRTVGLGDWQRADVQAGIMHVDATVSEEYTPQLLNYDISGVIDFKKGCYTGQEVVARMFYRGVAKKRMYLASSTVPVTQDDSVIAATATGQNNSPILAFNNAPAHSEEPNLLLAVLSTEAVEAEQSFALSSEPQVTLSILPLSY